MQNTATFWYAPSCIFIALWLLDSHCEHHPSDAKDHVTLLGSSSSIPPLGCFHVDLVISTYLYSDIHMYIHISYILYILYVLLYCTYYTSDTYCTYYTYYTSYTSYAYYASYTSYAYYTSYTYYAYQTYTHIIHIHIIHIQSYTYDICTPIWTLFNTPSL